MSGQNFSDSSVTVVTSYPSLLFKLLISHSFWTSVRIKILEPKDTWVMLEVSFFHIIGKSIHSFNGKHPCFQHASYYAGFRKYTNKDVLLSFKQLLF